MNMQVTGTFRILESARELVSEPFDSNADSNGRQQRRRALAARLRLQGLRGQKLGKHKVPVPVPDVQLGEDLSGSLRAMKVRD